jgi:hypothetical protein
MAKNKIKLPLATAVKRLPPKPATLRGLYLRSGNLCAFPKCGSVLVNMRGTMVGDICHIRAAEENGPRFDATMTNETRREDANLVLMCAIHHRQIDREHSIYTVAKLAKIKREHEKKFSEIEDTLTRRFDEQYQDETDSLDPTTPTTFARFDAAQRAGFDDEDRQKASRKVSAYIQKLGLLPDDDRNLTVAVIRRAVKVGRQQFSGVSVSVEMREFSATHKVSLARLKRFVATLESHGLGGHSELDPGIHHVTLNDPARTITWLDVAEYCETEGVDLEDVVVRLKFGLLD